MTTKTIAQEIALQLAELREAISIAKINSGRWPAGAPGKKGGQFAPKSAVGGSLLMPQYTFGFPFGAKGPLIGSKAQPGPNAKAHAKLGENGKPVMVNHPSIPSHKSTWITPNKTATFVPGGPTPDELNDIPLKPWKAPTTLEGWAKVSGQIKGLDEVLPFVPTPNKSVGSGVVIIEPDGRVWLTKPTNEFGGYKHTYPKGTAEPGLSLQANAIKEAYEETGLKVRITGILGDVERDTSKARFYIAERVGGTPADMGWESQAMRLTPRSQLKALLNKTHDQALVDRLNAALSVKKAKAPAGPAKGAWAAQPRWEAGTPIGGQWKSFDAAGLPMPPKVGSTSNPKWQMAVTAVYAAAATGDLGPASTLAQSAAAKLTEFNVKQGAGQAVNSQLKWAAGAAFYAIELMLAKVASTKATATAEKLAGPQPLSGWSKVGAKPGGSNPGAVYSDGEDKWLVKGNAKLVSGAVKQSVSDDRAKNEILAAKIMQTLGVGAPEMKLVDLQNEHGGGLGVASKMIDGTVAFNKSNKAHIAAAQADFAVHALLANYDVVGMSFDNLVMKDGKAVNIDPGGALLFRAQGLPKDSFGTTVSELNSLRDPKINPQAAAVFGSMTQSQIKISAKKLQALTDDVIDKLVDAHGPGDAAGKADLAFTLKKRRDYIFGYAGLDAKGNDPVAGLSAAPAPAAAAPAPAAAEPAAAAPAAAKPKASPKSKKDPIDKQPLPLYGGTNAGKLAKQASLYLQAAAKTMSLEELKALKTETDVGGGKIKVSFPKNAEGKKISFYTDQNGRPLYESGKKFLGYFNSLVAIKEAQAQAAAPGSIEAQKNAAATALLAATKQAIQATPGPTIPKFDSGDYFIDIAYSKMAAKMKGGWMNASAQQMFDALDVGNNEVTITLPNGEKFKYNALKPTANEVKLADYFDALLESKKANEKAANTASMATPSPAVASAAVQGAISSPPPAMPAKPPSGKLSSPSNPNKSLIGKVDNIASAASLFAEGKMTKEQALQAVMSLKFGSNSYGSTAAAYQAAVAAAISGGEAGKAPVSAPPQADTKSATKAKKTPTFKPDRISSPPDFKNWGGSGKSGPSGTQAVNDANQDATQKIFQTAKTGSIEAIKALKFPVIDKATGLPGAPVSVLEHPSQHVKSYATQVLNEIDSQLNPPKKFRWDGNNPAAQLDKSYPVHKGPLDGAAVKKIGYYVVLGNPGSVTTQQVGITQTTTYKSGALTEKTYASVAKAAIAKMPATQKQAVQSYTGSGYKDINSSLWKGNPSAKAKSAAQALKTLAHDIQPGTILSRKINLNSSDLDQITKATGMILQEPAIKSTSIDPSVWSGNVQFKMTVGPGVKGLYVGNGSDPNGGALSNHSGEKEVLLPPNTRMLVQKVTKQPAGDKDGFTAGNWLVEVLILPTD